MEKLYKNHVLATLVFIMVLLMGMQTYSSLPREKNPNFNFYAVSIATALPGASSYDVEKLVTDPLENAVARVPDVRTVSSTSYEGLSAIVVRFRDVDEATYERRVTDLRREVLNVANGELPKEAVAPRIRSVDSSNAMPSASVVVSGLADDENLRRRARYIARDLERLNGVDNLSRIGLNDPEFQIRFSPELLQGANITAVDLANTVQAHFRDTSAGTLRIDDQQWVIRLVGAVNDLEYLARLPINTQYGEIPLESVAEVERSREKSTSIVRYQGDPAVILNISKKASANTLELLDEVNAYIKDQNLLTEQTGIRLFLLFDQTDSIRDSVSVMEDNAVVGLIMVMGVTWLFLGWRIAFLTTIGLPFTLAGTFWLLGGLGYTLNNSVLLAVVISLGILVDDAIVVVEAIHAQLQKGLDAMEASLNAIEEVMAPVTAAVLTTIAAFLPLMLLPGILGQFMLVVPLVVTVALAVSLLEAFWMLPTHVEGIWGCTHKENSGQAVRQKIIWKLRLRYSRMLLFLVRRPRRTLAVAVLMFFMALAVLAFGVVKINFFASDVYRVFYVNVVLPTGTSLDTTSEKLLTIENVVREKALAGEIRAAITTAGQSGGKTGNHLGQIIVTLNPQGKELRHINEMVAAIRPAVESIGGVENINIRTFSDAPMAKPISIKVRGDDFERINQAADTVREILKGVPGGVTDVSKDDNSGRMELSFRLDMEAARRAGLDPQQVSRIIRLMVDGEAVARVQDRGENVDIRVMSQSDSYQDIDAFMRQTIALPGGGEIPIGQLLTFKATQGSAKLAHYRFKRSVRIEANIDKSVTNTVEANLYVQKEWQKIRGQYTDIDLDFTGELDDVKESLDALGMLFLFGMLLIFIILGTQFNSYGQPFLILLTVPMCFTGVIFGLLVTGNVLSLFTLYGVIALAGIAVNDAIVLISTANRKRLAGLSVMSAAIYAARRRLVPVLITSITTIAGLFSLAVGLAGYSSMWAPVAIAIVWGLTVSTVLTLVIIPILYGNFVGRGMPQWLSDWLLRLFGLFTARVGSAWSVTCRARLVSESAGKLISGGAGEKKFVEQRASKENKVSSGVTGSFSALKENVWKSRLFSKLLPDPERKALKLAEKSAKKEADKEEKIRKRQEREQKKAESVMKREAKKSSKKPAAVLAKHKEEEVIRSGGKFLQQGNTWKAMKLYAGKADKWPENLVLNRAAAETFLIYLQNTPKGANFDRQAECAKRFLDRLTVIEPEDPQCRQLLKLYRQIMS
jgi:multidrug efflux pump subunit AcrB